MAEVEQQEASRGKTIAVCSAKGGIGKTVIAVNLAISLVKKKRKVALMDGDFQFGDVNIAMNLQPSFTISDVVESIESIDAFSLSSYLTKHESGVRVLPTTNQPEFADLITPPVIEKISMLLAQSFDYLIIDTGVGLHDQSIAILEAADEILLVTTMELVSIKNTKLMLGLLEKLELREKVRIVVNRATMESVIQAKDVAGILKMDLLMYIPNHFPIVSGSLNLGVPFVTSQSKSDVAKAIFKIAEAIDSGHESLPVPKKLSFFDKLSPSKRKQRRE